jgi:predicted HTH transcriptional regulator
MITVERALAAKRESKHIEFKQGFDTAAAADWCEIIKDLAAIANSGGGAILFGVDNKGEAIGNDVSTIARLDPAQVTDKLHSYTGCHFSAFELVEAKKGRKSVAVLRLGPASIPLIFTKPGTYAIDDRKQKTAFGAGTLYFRHGAKSEPATTPDLADVLERRFK